MAFKLKQLSTIVFLKDPHNWNLQQIIYTIKLILSLVIEEYSDNLLSREEEPQSPQKMFWLWH